tara:strand:+ start:293 stop:925 length:633 start_codon:yes stop_codon:yes gene_type:complete
MTKNIGILIDKTGELKEVKINDMENLYKTCKLKKPDNFDLRHTWNVKIKSDKYIIKLHAKNDGRANTENKYDLPPPIDNDLFFGAMLVVGYDNDEEIIDMSLDLWEKIYEKLFGGFENLKDTAKEDEEEEDELDNIPDNMKTKEGYLKDGFIVGDDDDDEEDNDEDYDAEDDNDIDFDEDEDDEEDDDEEDINDCGSELAFDDYVYSDED